MARRQRRVMKVECAFNANPGQRTVGGHHLGQVSLTGQIARGSHQPHPLAQLPQTLVQRDFVQAWGFGEKSLHGHPAEGLVKLAGCGLRQIRLRRQQATPITRTAGNAFKCGMVHGLD